MHADRQAGLARLARFAPAAGRTYASRRNADTGPGTRHNVSMLSPYVRHRLLHEREVIAAALARHSRSAAEKFVQEVFWRSYFKGWLEHRPSVWRAYRDGLDLELARLANDDGLRARVERATAGDTGIDCFDAWAAELVQTGYLHNHARMWFASIWVYTLQLPWQLGADFFLRHLMDGDPASNTLSWRWVCGLHTRGKTYLARAENIARYTDGRFRPVGLASEAPPLHEDASHPLRAPGHGDEQGEGRCLLLVTEDDCLPETLRVAAPPSAVLGLLATDARSPLAVGEAARRFARDAVRDAVARAQGAFGVAGRSEATTDWAAAIIDAAREAGVQTVVLTSPPTGPVADALADAEPSLRVAGIRLCRLRRRWDALVWPHARHGFFKLRKRIPDLLDACEVSADMQTSLDLPGAETL